MIAPLIELELRKLGLTEKEVRVYLAGSELGPSSVQNIAQRADLTRPTTYEILKKLKEKGLFAEAPKESLPIPSPRASYGASRLPTGQAKQKKKRYFVAQSPERILGLLRVQKREIEEKEREFIRIIAVLEAKYSKEKEGIKIYRGREGLKALEEILSFSSTPEILVINSKMLPISQQKRERIYQKIKKRLGKIVVKEFDAKFEGSLIIFDKIIFFPLKKSEGILIENP